MISSPERRWICEAQKPGKASHHFETFGEDAARAMCDLRGWEFLRCYQEGSDSDRPARPQKDAGRLVSPQQLKALIVEAQQTYRALTKNGIDLPEFDDWRKDVLSACVRIESFRAVRNSQFPKVRDRFRELRGAPALGFGNPARRQSREEGDTLAQREQRMYLIAAALGDHARVVEKPATDRERTASEHALKKGGYIGIPYLVSIAAAKNRGQAIEDLDDLIKLPVSRLKQLLFTIRNRIATREGRGENSGRNKKQRKKKDGPEQT